MKAFLLSGFFFLAALSVSAQNGRVNTLPPGKYETVTRNNQDKWNGGDIILLDDNKYKVSISDEVGDYKFSITAQRIFFTSGPLKSLYAKTSISNNTPAIVLPVSENAELGLKLPSEVWGYFKN